MTTNEQAKKFYEEKVTRAIDELIDEYNGREDHWACEYDAEPFEVERRPSTEAQGILVKFPDGGESKVSVSWTENTNYVTIGRIWVSISETLSFEQADIGMLKESIRWMLEKNGLNLSKIVSINN